MPPGGAAGFGSEGLDSVGGFGLGEPGFGEAGFAAPLDEEEEEDFGGCFGVGVAGSSESLLESEDEDDDDSFSPEPHPKTELTLERAVRAKARSGIFFAVSPYSGIFCRGVLCCRRCCLVGGSQAVLATNVELC